MVSEESLKCTKLEPQNSLTTTLKSKRMKKHQDWKRRSQNLDHMKLLSNARNKKLRTKKKCKQEEKQKNLSSSPKISENSVFTLQPKDGDKTSMKNVSWHIFESHL